MRKLTMASVIGLGFASALAATSASAACVYTVSNSWGAGFTASIRVTNDTGVAVTGWQVNWKYAKNSVSSAWNAQLSGSYSATNLAWNGHLNPGQSAEFGVQGLTNGGAVEIPTIAGALCGSSATSSVPAVSSSASSVVNVSSAGRSSSSSVAPVVNNIATLATATTSFVSSWETLRAVNDNSNPANSNDKSAGAYGNWNNPNSIQWVQFDWPQNYSLSNTQIYWFDDNGGVLTPTRAYIEYWNGSAWVNAGNVPLVKNAFNTLALNGIVTGRLRVSMLNATQSTGILEWRVAGSAAGTISSSNSSNAVSSSSRISSSAALTSSSRSSLVSSVAQSSSSVRTSASVMSSSSSSSRAAVSSSLASSSSAAVFTPITTQYEYEGINTSNAAYKDSNRFRLYYGAANKLGPKGNLGTHSDADVTRMLEHMEKVYDYFVTSRGFKSPAQSIHASRPGFFKINVYSVTDIDAGGFMGYNGTAGLSYLVMRSNLLNVDSISTHEFGHGITLAEAIWIDKARTGAWWETTAEWFADAYISPLNNTTNFNVESLHAGSYRTIVHKDNLYEAWPFLNYLSNNPDNYSNLGRDAIRNLIRAYQGQETPLHSLARLVQPVSVQTLVGRYRARIAYGDIGHPLVQSRVLSAQRDASFRTRAYRNLEAVDSTTWRVIAARKPQYTGSNIIPLTATGSGQISIQVTNLGNGLSDSNFTAVVAIKASNNAVRYVDLPSGAGNFQLAAGEESSLVVTNTPNNLYLYNAFETTDTSPEAVGLNYQVQIIGARPRD